MGSVIDINGTWHALGPALVANGQANINGISLAARVPVTGRVTVVAANPMAPLDDVWVGSATGGLWHGGIQPITGWQRENAAGSPAIGAIQLDNCSPSACADVWVGTGEDAIRRDTQYGDGVYHGTLGPGGYSWTGPLGSSLFARGAITGIVLDPTTSGSTKRVVVALSSGKTSNAAHSSVTTTPAGSYGIYLSNLAGIDGSWISTLTTVHPATALEIDPANPAFVWAGIRDEGFYISTQTGASWLPVTESNIGIPDSVRTTADWPTLSVYHAGNVLRLYATLGTCPSPFTKPRPYWCTPNVYMSTDGTSWTRQTAPADVDATCPKNAETYYGYYCPLSSYLSYTHAIAINPANPDNVCIGGINVFCSTTSGTPPWGRAGVKQLHQDHHDLKIFLNPAPNVPAVIYDANDGGLAVSLSDVDTWNLNFQSGLAISQTQGVALSALLPNTIFAGTQDNGGNYYDGTPIWEHRGDGDAAFPILDADDKNIAYEDYVGQPITRCDSFPGPCGQTGYDFSYVTDPTQNMESSSWYPPTIQDPNTTVAPIFGTIHPIYTTTERLYQSKDRGFSWTDISALTDNTKSFGHGWASNTTFTEIDAHNPITAVAIAAASSDRIFVGFYDGEIWTTADGTSPMPSWSNASGGLPARPVTSIAVAPTGTTNAFASFAGFGDHSVFTTVNGGASWAPFDSSAGDFANKSVSVLAFETLAPYHLWAGTDDGVWVQPNPLLPVIGPWLPITNGLPRVAVYDIKIDNTNGFLVAGTHGNGVWALTKAPLPYFNEAACCGHESLDNPYVHLAASQFDPFQTCTITLHDPSGLACAPPSSLDADGAILMTDADGNLAASKPGSYSQRPTAWACFNGTCAGGFSSRSCKVSTVDVSCGRRSVTGEVRRTAAVRNPPSTVFPIMETPTAAGTFTLSPTLKQPNPKKNSVLCSVTSSFTAGEDPAAIISAAVAAINASGACASAGVRAILLGTAATVAHEDPQGPTPALALTAPALSGVQLFTALSAPSGVSWTVDLLGIPVSGMQVPPRVTLSGKAAGGTVSITERSRLGLCKQTVTTAAGDSAATVAANIAAAFTAQLTTPAQFFAPDCLSAQNPRDVNLKGSDLRFPIALQLTVASTDPGITWAIDAN